MNISFGKRIPISTTQIYNKNTNEFEKATLYELDGRDESDVDELVDFGDWRYRYEMSINLFSKIKGLASPEKLSDFMKYTLEHNKFYILKTEDDKLAAICQTQGFKNCIILKETKQRDMVFADKLSLLQLQNIC